MTQTQEHNVPALRFPEFSGEWNSSKISELAEVITGNTPDTSRQEYYGGDIPFYSPADIPEAGGIISKSKKTLTDAGLQKVREIPEKATLFVCIGSTIGKVAQTSVAGATNQQINTVVAKNNSDPSFLFFSLCKNAPRIRELTAVQAVPIVNKSTFSKEKLFSPTLPEQQKIASFLSQVDRKIAQLSEKKALLQAYKKGMMQKLFSQELRFKDPQGHDFPDWEEKRLGDFYDFKSTNSLSRDKLNYDGGTVRNIHYGDIHTKFKPSFDLLQEQVPFINSDVDLSRISEDKYCQNGDLVIADASEDYDDIGKAIELKNLNNEMVLAGLHTLLARLTSNGVFVGFGAFVMACASVRKQIKIIAQGTKVLGISAGRMAEVTLPMPHPKEQQKIADFLSSIDRKIDLVADELDHAKAFKKGLLQQMFI